MPSLAANPYPGIRVHTSPHGATVLRLHYEADPDKGLGEKVFVPEINEWLTPWALAEFKKMTDPAIFRQEYLIDGAATLGELIFQFHEEATIEEAFPIPPEWTRYYALDPHPGVPHAHLWVAIDPWGDAWAYREFWPSGVYGKPGLQPQGERGGTIKEHCEVVQYMESGENPENCYKGRSFDEKIHKRVIDYAARAFGKDQDNPDAENYQKRFESRAKEIAQDRKVDFSMRFEDARKDLVSGQDTVNEWLKPREIEGKDGTWKNKSRLHIFSHLSELIYELKNVRRQQLSPEQAQRMDPTGLPVPVRKHLVDDLRYICMANPVFISPTVERQTWKPTVPGIAY